MSDFSASHLASPSNKGHLSISDRRDDAPANCYKTPTIVVTTIAASQFVSKPIADFRAAALLEPGGSVNSFRPAVAEF